MSDANPEPRRPAPPTEADWKARRGRNIALALGLALFMVLIFVVTVVKLGANVLDRPI